jgi:hypothetical protein
MKKLSTAFAACMLAGFVSAQVESQNIVGYTTSAINSATWYQIAPTFIPVGGTETSGTAINDIFTTGFVAGDKLYVWNQGSQSYDNYTWMAAPYDENFDTAPAGWADLGEMRTVATLKIGQSVFLRKISAGATSVVFSGEVKAALVTTVPSATWVQVSLPYPTDIALNDAITWTGFTAGDKVYVWNTGSQSYANYTWMLAPYDENFDTAPAGWADLGEMRTTTLIPLGSTMFIYKVSAGAGTFAKAL